MSHWYTKNGEAMHRVPGKTVAERDTTIADARTMGLLPSVSGITKMWNNPGLDRWKQDIAIESALKYAKTDYTESSEWSNDDLLHAAIRAEANKIANAAADLGVKIHAAIESALGCQQWENETVGLADGKQVELKELVDPALAKLEELGINIVETEKVVTCSSHGYAGQMDVSYVKGNIAGVLDFKSTKTKPTKKIEVRQGQSMQIAAYHYACWGSKDKPHFQPNHQGINLYISTTEIGRVDVVKYDAAELAKQWDGFLACLTLWRLQNNYDPRTKEVV
jgi:hypothetical protein